VTEFHVEVVRVGAIEKHPNADTLGVTRVADYPVIVRLGQFKTGDLAVYVPVDSVVPDTEQPRWSFLAGHRRIRAKKLRGMFSMGLLTEAEPTWLEGQNVAAELGITKYEEPESPGQSFGSTFYGDLPDPGYMPKYTDIDGLRRYPNLLTLGEEVVITEKIHGENARFCFEDGQLWVGSRTRIKKPGIGAWWRAAEQHGLAEKLASLSTKVAIFGECHGYTGGFPYGTEKGVPALRFFDVWDRTAGRYLDDIEARMVIATLGLDYAPILYRGPWDPTIARELAEGKSTLDGSHVREGVVIKPTTERWNDRIGRVILKLHGEGFLLK
jgi:RNA ligase (TIGR02306 family)